MKKIDLAKYLGVKPSHILTYTIYADEGHIDYITADFHKRSAPYPLPANTQTNPLPSKTNTLPTVPGLPADRVVFVLTEPRLCNREELRLVAAALGIQDATQLNKRPLVSAIKKWEKQHNK